MRLCTKRTEVGHRFAAACGQHARRRVHGDDLGFRRDGKQCRGGGAGAAARVEQP